MPATDPPDPPPAPAPPTPTTPNASAPPTRRPGRPGVEHADVITAIDTFIARTARHPSLRELRTALGGTGSPGKLGPILRAHKAERLLVGDAPAPRSAEAAVTQALNAALGLLAEEASEAAEAVVADGARDAERRVEAADALRVRAESAAAESDLGRERALGRVGALEDTVADLRRERDTSARTLEAARERERDLVEAIGALERDAREHDHVRERLEARVAEAEAESAHRQADADAARVAADKTRFACTEELGEMGKLVRISEESARDAHAETLTLRERTAALERTLAEAGERATRFGTERDDARERAGRLDGTLEAHRARMQTLDAELDAARRTIADLHGHAGRLQGQLVAAGIASADIAPPPAPRVAERQDALDLGRDAEGKDSTSS